jgi:N12 class adenine-specific DNA methylase
LFEFHGWACIRVEEHDLEKVSETRLREDHAIERIRSKLDEVSDDFSSLFEVRRTSNGLIVLLAHGLRNHRYEPAIELFEWVARDLPDSYGLLYVNDDERVGFDNEFRAWRLALGEVSEHADPFLSPYVPTVERPLKDD